jgi:hypothetical protein
MRLWLRCACGKSKTEVWPKVGLRSIPEFGGRVLRVAVNTAVEPNRVVSVFFDRKMKGKL